MLGAASRSVHRIASERDLDLSLPQVMRELGMAVRADRALVMPIVSSGPAAKDHAFTIASEWIAEGSDAKRLTDQLGGKPTPFVGDNYDFTRRFELARAGKPIVYGSVHALPQNETSLAQQVGTRSSLRVPVLVDGKPVSMLGFDHTRTAWAWGPDELLMMWLVADVVSLAMTNFAHEERRPGPPFPPGASTTTVSWVRCAGSLFRSPELEPALPTILQELAATLQLRRVSFTREEPPSATFRVRVPKVYANPSGWLSVEDGSKAAVVLPLLESFANVIDAAIVAPRRASALQPT